MIKHDKLQEQELNNKRLNKIKTEVFSVKYFYERYNFKYPPIMFGGKGKINKKKIPLKLYKKIILTYFDIYFKELYFKESTMYFLYSGMMRKVLYSKRVIIKNKKKTITEPSIGFFWYERPSLIFFLFLKIVRLTGSTNKIPQIEKIFKNNFSLNIIPNFEEVIKETQISKKLHRL